MRYLVGSERCCDIICIGPKAFVNLCGILQREGGLRPTQRATIEEQVAKFLYLIGHNVRNCATIFFFRRSGETVSRHFHSVLNSLLKLEQTYLKQNDGEQVAPEILNNNRFYPYFKVNNIFKY